MASRVMEARAHVLRSIRAGLAPGAAVSVKDTASALRISHTPVREAMERLVGEGLLTATQDRHGFAVPLLTVRDVAGLHALFGLLLDGLSPLASASPEPAGELDHSDGVSAVEWAVSDACRIGRPAMIAAAVRTTDLRLSCYRRVEPAIVPDWAEGVRLLRAGLATGGDAASMAISGFTEARTQRAETIVAAVEDIHERHTRERSRI